MKALILQRWETVREAIPAALEGADIEGVHDVRVASRRLRAAMDIAAPVFQKGWYKPLHRSAKEITRALGEVRDRDVLLEALRTERETAPLAEIRGIDRLIARVDGERVVARAEMERFLVDLLASDLWNDVARRFGNGSSAGSPSNGARRR
jgi:CHAD domain-containing protein